jgi:uncharacterized membrane protein
MTCKTKLFLWYLCAGTCVSISAVLDSWFGFGWFVWVIPLAIFSFLIAFGVLAHPVPKAGNNIDKYAFVKLLEVLLIIVSAIAVIVNFLVYKNGEPDTFFEFFNLWAFRLVIVCLVIVVLMHIREEIGMAAKIDKDLQSNANRN